MSFFSRLGDAWTASKESIGGAWTWASQATAPKHDKQDTGIGPLDWFANNVEDPVGKFIGDYTVDPVMRGLNAIGSTTNRAVSTFGQTISGGGGGNSDLGVFNFFAHPSAVKENWKKTGSDVTDTQGNAAEGISAGQSFVSSLQVATGQDVKSVLAMDPETAKARQKFFHDDPAGQIASGAIDLATAWFGDPLVLGGKAVKGLDKASTTVKTADRANALDLAVGKDVTAGTSRQARAAEKLKSLYARTDGMSAGDIARLPEFQTTADAGAFAYLFERANKAFPEDQAARHSLKNDIWGSALGDARAIGRLKAGRDELAAELERLVNKPAPTRALDNFAWEDGGQGMFGIAQDAVPALTAGQIAQVDREIERLNRAVDASYSPTSTVGLTDREIRMAPGREYTKFQNDTAKIHESWADLSMAGRPIRVITRATGARLPGHINIKNPADGLTQLTDYLTQAKYLDGETKSGLIDSYVRAATDNGRRAVVDKVEKAVVDAYGRNFGLDVNQAKNMLETIQIRRNAVYNQLKSRLYSAAPEDNTVSFHDPEDDITHVFHKPLLQSQIEEHHALTDPRLIEQALGKGTRRRIIDKWLGAKGADMAEGMKGVGDDVMTMTTKLWKDAALLRFAYPMRVQIDTQGRLITHMGMMQYMALLKSSLPGAMKYAIMRRDSDILDATRKALVTGKEDDLLSQIMSPARNDEELAKIVRTIQAEDGELANLGSEVSAMELRRQRGSDGWGKVETTDPEWFNSYLRAVRQVKASPTAMKAAEVDDLEAIKAFVNSDSAARREWMSMSEGHPSQEEWIASVQAHVRHLAPSPELRSFLLKGQMPGQGVMDAGKALAAGEVRVGATSRLDETVPHYGDAAAEAIAARREASAALAKSKELKAKVANLPKRSSDPTARALREEWRVAREANRKAGAKAVVAEARARKLRALTKGDEKQARSAASAQHEIMNPDRTDGMTLKQLEDHFSGENQANRMPVHGQKHSPLEKSAFREWHERNRKRWYKWASDVPETIMGRSPLYSFSFKSHMKEALDRLDGYDSLDAIPENVITAMRKGADSRARRDVANILFDTSHTSNLAYHFRYLSPFFSAWEDTMKKWSGLFYDKPWAAERFVQAWDAPNNAGLVVDSEGNRVDKDGRVFDAKTGELITRPTYSGTGEYVMLPKFLSPPGLGGGAQLRVRKDSINIIFQGQPWWLPGFGPIVQVPANEIVRSAFPKEADDPIMKYILPFGVTSDSKTTQLMPSWVKQARNAFGGTQDYADQYAVFLAQEVGRFQRGERKSMPSQKELAGRTRNWFILNAAMKNASPVSITPTPRSQFWIERARAYRNEYFADTKAYTDKHGGRDWQAQFLNDFPEYFEQTMTLTKNQTGIQATDSGYDAIQKFGDSIRANPEFGWMFAGPENKGEFSGGVYNWMRATSLGPGKGTFLDKMSPDEALKKVQAEKGWIEYNQIAEMVQAEMDRRGIKSTREAPDLAAAKKAAVDSIAKTNLSWWAEFNSRDGATVDRLISAAQQGWKDHPLLADRQDQKALKDYIDVRAMVRYQLVNDREFHTLDAKANSDLAKAWDSYVAGLRAQSIGFAEIYDRVLEADDLNKELVLSGV